MLQLGFGSEPQGGMPADLHEAATCAPTSEQVGAGESAAVRETGPADGGVYRGPHTAPAAEELAANFPQLEIIELLGQGGMGAVYKARQPGLDRLVAVKVLPPDAARDAAFAERFTREARALARLNHPNIVAVYDFGQTKSSDGRSPGLFYFVMEFVDGLNLRQLIHTGQCKPEQALSIVPQICEALQFAHDEGIVHRDIKPENILIDKRGRLKIADFGLARLLSATQSREPDAVAQRLTYSGQVMGTPSYMAPEQMDDPLRVDHRADIYSLGVVFYEMLTGELPRGRFAPPSQKVAVDVRLDEVVLRTLEQEPQRRYQHASEVKTDVESISRAPQAPSRAATAAPTPRGKRDASTYGLTHSCVIVFCLLGIASVFLPWGDLRWYGTEPGVDPPSADSHMVSKTWHGFSSWHGKTMIVILLAQALMRIAAGIFTRPRRWQASTLLAAGLVVLVLTYVSAQPVAMVRINGGAPHLTGGPLAGVGVAAAIGIALLVLSMVELRITTSEPMGAASPAAAGVEARRQRRTPPRVGFSRFAIAGAVWAVFGLLTIIPVFYFIGLDRVRNGTALPTDLIYEEPPLAFTLFMGVLLAIGSGAPIGTTIFGALAIQHIRRSGGQIYGLPLAVADAIFFPLLLVGGTMGALAAAIVAALAPESATPLSLAAFAVLVGMVVCVFAGRAAWRAICRTGQGAHRASRKWFAALVLLGVCIITAVFVFRGNWRPLGPRTSVRAERESSESKSERVAHVPSPGWVIGNDGPILTDTFAGVVLGLEPSKIDHTNRALQNIYREYLTIEAQHTERETNEAGHSVVRIGPFVRDIEKLENRLWTELDAIMDERQQSIARLNLNLDPAAARPINVPVPVNELVQPGFFGWGELGLHLEIWRVGTWYHWTARTGRYESSSNAPELPVEYRRFLTEAE
jgi:serine/threonine protein kinase